MQTFMIGLKPDARMLLDASVGGTMKIKTTTETKSWIENKSQKDYMSQSKEVME